MPRSATDAGTRRWWFVYYRVKADDLATAMAAARMAQLALQTAHPGLEASLMQRVEPDAPDARQPMTLMETYSAPLDWPEARLGAVPEAIAATAGRALTPWLQGARHLEVFDPCAWPR